jgi:hypothetical protein
MKESEYYLETSFCASLSLKMSTPPTQVTLAPSSVWKPVTTESWLVTFGEVRDERGSRRWENQGKLRG